MEKRKTKADSPDMSWKFEACIVAIGALVLAAFLAVVMLREAEAGPAPVSHFIQADYEVFDRNFKISGKSCDVGLAYYKICMESSPLESEIQRGEILPDYIPALGAEFRVIVATSLKDEHLRMFRYGQTLVLLEPRTRRVEDILDLTAPDFMSAQNGPTQPKV
tara:strand:+ start:390 stop:878 length:489 start_codon:yes stop_codon:yes gene_type:complete